MPRGRIDFEPDTAKGNQGPGGTGEIRDGQYVTMPGKGVVGGPYTVRISGSDGVAAPLESEGIVDPLGAPLFPEHVEHIDLPKEDSTRDFAVPN